MLRRPAARTQPVAALTADAQQEFLESTMKAALAASRDEGWHELAALSDDARRRHVHWTHVCARALMAVGIPTPATKKQHRSNV